MAKQSTPAVTADNEPTNREGTGPAEENERQAGAGGTEAGMAPGNDLGEDDGMRMMVGEQVLVISAPGGPRRRAGFAFGPVPVDLRWDELGETDDERKDVLDRLRADPLLKIDGRMEERPADD